MATRTANPTQRFVALRRFSSACVCTPMETGMISLKVTVVRQSGHFARGARVMLPLTALLEMRQRYPGEATPHHSVHARVPRSLRAPGVRSARPPILKMGGSSQLDVAAMQSTPQLRMRCVSQRAPSGTSPPSPPTLSPKILESSLTALCGQVVPFKKVTVVCGSMVDTAPKHSLRGFYRESPPAQQACTVRGPLNNRIELYVGMAPLNRLVSR